MNIFIYVFIEVTIEKVRGRTPLQIPETATVHCKHNYCIRKRVYLCIINNNITYGHKYCNYI